MTVKELSQRLSLKELSLPEAQREITGGYTGDLLSWVMGRAQSGDVWITIMSNINIAAVAQLTDTACILLAEGVTLAEDVIAVARDKGVNILASEEPAFTLCGKLAALL